MPGLMASIRILGLLTSAYFQMTSSILAIYAKGQLGASISDVALIISAFYATSAASNFLIGMVARWRDPRPLLIISLFLISVAPISYGLAEDPLILMASRALEGFAFALYSTTALTLCSMTSSSPSERDASIVAYTSSLALGMMAGPAMGSLAIAGLGLRNTFFLAALFPAAAIALVWLSIRGLDVRLAPRRGRRASLGGIFGNGAFLSAISIYWAFAIIYSVFLAYATIYAKEGLSFSSDRVALLFFGYFSMTALGRFFIGRLVRSIGKRMALALSAAGAIALSSIISSFRSPQAFAMAFALMGIPHGIIYPTGAMIIADEIGPESLVRANSFYLLSWNLGAIMGPLFASGIATLWGIPAAIMASAIPMAASLLFAVVLKWAPGLRNHKKGAPGS
ncbi:MAG: MFS transporter [Candidatus Bathyarchaeia archaeon]